MTTPISVLTCIKISEAWHRHTTFSPLSPCLPMSEITWLRVFFGTLCPQRAGKFSAAFSTPQKRRLPLTSFSKLWHCGNCQSGHPWRGLTALSWTTWRFLCGLDTLSSSTNRWTRETVWKPLILVSSIQILSWRAVVFPWRSDGTVHVKMPDKCKPNKAASLLLSSLVFLTKTPWFMFYSLLRQWCFYRDAPVLGSFL